MSVIVIMIEMPLKLNMAIWQQACQELGLWILWVYEIDMLQMEIIQMDGTPELTELGGTNPYKQPYTKPGFQRGNPDNNDSYFFVIMSIYKKLNSQSKAYRTINMHQKRKNKSLILIYEEKCFYHIYIPFCSF